MIPELRSHFIFDNIDLLLTWLPDFIGCSGALIVLIAYALLQTKKLEAEGVIYSLLNLLGAVMILISLIYSWNLSAVLMEIAWLGISFFGIVKGISATRSKFRNSAEKSY